jgi:hypothetical protein
MTTLSRQAAILMSVLMFTLCLFLGSAKADDAKSYVAFECSFPRTVGAIEEKHKWTESGWEAEAFGFTIAAVNVAKRTAQIIGNAGASDLIALAGSDSLNFLEQTAAGNLALTTIFSGDKDAAFLAVTSRHMNGFGAAIVSQKFGSCRGKK